MALEDLRARLDRMLADLQGVGGRAAAAGLYDALVETRAAMSALREAMVVTDRELARERTRLVDAERRGRLARDIDDRETAELADLWTGKHRERVDLLERKRQVQLDELAYAERQQEDLSEAYRKARLGLGSTPGPIPVDPELDRAAVEQDRQAREAVVQAQLAALKKKLGRQG